MSDRTIGISIEEKSGRARAGADDSDGLGEGQRTENQAEDNEMEFDDYPI